MRFAITVALATVSALVVTTHDIGHDTVVSGPDNCVTLLAHEPPEPGVWISKLTIPHDVGATCVYHHGKKYSSPSGRLMQSPEHNKQLNRPVRSIHI